MEVEPSLFLLRVLVVPQPLVLGLAGIVGFVPAAAALQNQDLVARLGQAARGDGAAEAAADHDCVEVHGYTPAFLT